MHVKVKTIFRQRKGKKHEEKQTGYEEAEN